MVEPPTEGRAFVMCERCGVWSARRIRSVACPFTVAKVPHVFYDCKLGDLAIAELGRKQIRQHRYFITD